MFPPVPVRAWSGAAAPWLALGAAVAALALAAAFVDPTPRVEGDFFFSDDDPQLATSRAIDARFVTDAQVVVRVADTTGLPRRAYQEAVGTLAAALAEVEGVRAVYSVATHDPAGPLYGRILLTPDSSATNVVLTVDDTDPEVLLPRLERVVATRAPAGLDVVLSGVPVIVEQLRRSLLRDLVVFSGAAVLVFALLIGLVYRDPAIVLGTLATCALSVCVTLGVVQALGVSIGLLTANLVTIVFVLTLSHAVFLTANWLRGMDAHRGADGRVAPADRPRALARGVRETLEASFWSMATTLLGFLSLLVATAEPLRELGVAGAVGTVVALGSAYLAYPAFLGRWARGRPSAAGGVVGRGRARVGWRVVGGLAAAVAVLGLGLARLDTDPGLLTYFDDDGALRQGLERVDRDGGSSTLKIVVRDPGGGRLDTRDAYTRMQAYQRAVEADSLVGVALSPAVLIDQARTAPLARLLPLGVLLDLAAGERFDRVALGFVTEDRTEGLYSLRLKESLAGEPRAQVIERLVAPAAETGLEVTLVGGFYDLQRQLGVLIRDSLRIGVGGLLALFLLVALVVSRSAVTAAWMWGCLTAIPLVVLGTFGWAGMAVDIITSPAANVALAMGVDSMIHLVVRVRRLGGPGRPDAWTAALAQIRGPVVAASGIICAGFGIFVLSTFPPTVRFGLAVILGTLTAAAMALLVLPRVAGARAGV